jgi:hypothetical protein
LHLVGSWAFGDHTHSLWQLSAFRLQLLSFSVTLAYYTPFDFTLVTLSAISSLLQSLFRPFSVTLLIQLLVSLSPTVFGHSLLPLARCSTSNFWSLATYFVIHSHSPPYSHFVLFSQSFLSTTLSYLTFLSIVILFLVPYLATHPAISPLSLYKHLVLYSPFFPVGSFWISLSLLILSGHAVEGQSWSTAGFGELGSWNRRRFM